MSENINVDEIVSQIRAEIKEKGLESSMLSFEDVPFDKEVSHSESHFELSSLVQSVDYVNARNQIEPYKEITGNPIARASTIALQHPSFCVGNTKTSAQFSYCGSSSWSSAPLWIIPGQSKLYS